MLMSQQPSVNCFEKKKGIAEKEKKWKSRKLRAFDVKMSWRQDSRSELSRVTLVASRCRVPECSTVLKNNYQSKHLLQNNEQI